LKKKSLYVLVPLLIILSGFENCKKSSTYSDCIDQKYKMRLSLQVKKCLAYLNQNQKYNQDVAFFIDMKILSGKNRFFVYDLKKDKIIDKGLVAHGSGSETGIEGQLSFSNKPNSYQTSLGKYSIENSYKGQFGKANRLSGLDITNNNAKTRNIVLHKYDDVPYDEQDEPIANSLGCPMVNKMYFERIEKIIDNSKKNILLIIYY